MKSGRPRWLQTPRQVPITFEAEDLETFKESLPKGVSLSEGIRELVRVGIDQKNAESPKRLSILSSEIRQTTITEYVGQAIKTLQETTDAEILDFIMSDKGNQEILRQVRQRVHNVLFRKCGLTLTKDEQIGVVKVPRCY